MRLSAAVAVLGLGVAASASAAPIGDPEKGAAIYARECAACHQIGEGARDRIGPHLNGVFGRRFGGLDGFGYSRPMKRMGNEGMAWDLPRLDAYVTNPRALVSGTRMSYRGLRDETARADLIAFIRENSDMPMNIPESAPTAIKSVPELPPEVLAIEGDAEYGEYLAQECTTCHQRDGSAVGIPSIVGWPEEDFVVAMHAYKQRLRSNQAMQMMASRLADDEIAALAAYFATLD